MTQNNEVVYRTMPRLFIISMYFLGFVFFGLLTWLTWTMLSVSKSWIVLFLTGLFSITSLLSFYYFISIKIAKLTTSEVIIAYLFLPIQNRFLLSEIGDISQKTKTIDTKSPFSVGFSFASVTTNFELSNNKILKVSSIGNMEFEELKKGFNKLKNGNHHYIAPKQSFLLYLLDNLDGLLWVVVTLVVTIGLGHALLNH
jgi:hypothetical protein